MSVNDMMDWDVSSGGSDLLGDESELNFRYLSPKDIEPDPDQPRTRGVEDVDDILKDFETEEGREEGIRQPIDVTPLGNGKYRLVNGERRWFAATLAKLPRIPAMIKSYDESEASKLRKKLIQLKDNQQRQDVDPRDEGAAMLDLKDSGMSVSDIAKEMTDKDAKGKSKQMTSDKVKMLMDIARADQDEEYRFISELFDPPVENSLHEKEIQDLKLISNLYRAALKNPTDKVKALIYHLIKLDKLDRASSIKLKSLDYSLPLKELKETLFLSEKDKLRELESRIQENDSKNLDEGLDSNEQESESKESDMSDFEIPGKGKVEPEEKIAPETEERKPATKALPVAVYVKVNGVEYQLLPSRIAKKEGCVVLCDIASGVMDDFPLKDVKLSKLSFLEDKANES